MDISELEQSGIYTDDQRNLALNLLAKDIARELNERGINIEEESIRKIRTLPELLELEVKIADRFNQISLREKGFKYYIEEPDSGEKTIYLSSHIGITDDLRFLGYALVKEKKVMPAPFIGINLKEDIEAYLIIKCHDAITLSRDRSKSMRSTLESAKQKLREGGAIWSSIYRGRSVADIADQGIVKSALTLGGENPFEASRNAVYRVVAVNYMHQPNETLRIRQAIRGKQTGEDKQTMRESPEENFEEVSVVVSKPLKFSYKERNKESVPMAASEISMELQKITPIMHTNVLAFAVRYVDLDCAAKINHYANDEDREAGEKWLERHFDYTLEERNHHSNMYAIKLKNHLTVNDVKFFEFVQERDYLI